MSVDNTINELSNTLSELGRLVNHINGQIVGITGRINITLDNFDNSVAKVAGDAAAVTGQVGETVSQVPNSWVFYMLFITLIIVFILLSIVLFLNLITKMHAIYIIVKGKETDKIPILDDGQSSSYPDSGGKQGYGNNSPTYTNGFRPQPPPSAFHPVGAQMGGSPLHGNIHGSLSGNSPTTQVAIPMEYEPPRRFGGNDFGSRRDGSYIADDTTVPPPPRPYQRRTDDRSGVYNLESGVASSYPTRSMRSQEV